MNSRRAHLEVSYNNMDITAELQKYIISWGYTDNLSGQADDLQITLEDRAGLWSGEWFPEHGATLKAKLVRENWEKEGVTDSVVFGLFEIDEIDGGGSPSTVTIKAISVPDSTSLRREGKHRAWEETKLSIIASDIARGSGMTLFYDTDDNPEYDRKDQSGESDLTFLNRICMDAGLCLKVTGKQVAIFDERKYEAQAPIETIKRGDHRIKSYSFRSSLTAAYKACRVEYRDTETESTIRHTFTPPNPPKTGRVLLINERVKSVADAQKLAKNRLRQANKDVTTSTLTMLGDIKYAAGLTVNLDGFGKLSGKYIITRVTHSGKGGYETNLDLRLVLEGY